MCHHKSNDLYMLLCGFHITLELNQSTVALYWLHSSRECVFAMIVITQDGIQFDITTLRECPMLWTVFQKLVGRLRKAMKAYMDNHPSLSGMALVYPMNCFLRDQASTGQRDIQPLTCSYRAVAMWQVLIGLNTVMIVILTYQDGFVDSCQGPKTLGNRAGWLEVCSDLSYIGWCVAHRSSDIPQ